MDGDFLKPVDPRSPEAQEALRALLGTTLAQLNEIDKNVVGSSSNIRGVKTDLKNVLQNIQSAPVPQHTSQPIPQHISQPTLTPISMPVPVHAEPKAPLVNFDNNKIDKIVSLLEDIKNILSKNT